jgi:PTS system mannose-specific IIC component
MEINMFQAILLGLCACLSSMPGLGGTTFGNYTLGRPLVAGLVVGLILGDVQTGIIIGAAIQVIYIALVTPGGTVSADVRAVSYIGIPLAICAVRGMGLDPDTAQAQSMAAALGAAVGTLGTVLFYGTATMNLIWQHIGWKAVERGDFQKLYLVDMGLPWISHLVCSFIPTVLITMAGAGMVDVMKEYMPMDGIAMKTLFTVGSLLPAVGVAILLKQVVKKSMDFVTFFFGFTMAACLGLNLIASAIIGTFFAAINYKVIMANNKKAASVSADDDDEEDI